MEDEEDFNNYEGLSRRAGVQLGQLKVGINPDYVNTFVWGCHLMLVEVLVGIYNHYQTTSHQGISVYVLSNSSYCS